MALPLLGFSGTEKQETIQKGHPNSQGSIRGNTNKQMRSPPASWAAPPAVFAPCKPHPEPRVVSLRHAHMRLASSSWRILCSAARSSTSVWGRAADKCVRLRYTAWTSSCLFARASLSLLVKLGQLQGVDLGGLSQCSRQERLSVRLSEDQLAREHREGRAES